jgi:hypothetical protein
MNHDGSNPVQITHLDGFQPGRSFVFGDGKSIVFRGWRSEDSEAKEHPLPMDLFTI